MYNPLLLPELREMLDNDDQQGLGEFCTALYPGVAAEVLEGLSNREIWHVLSHCDIARQVEIFKFLSLVRQAELVTSVDRERLSGLMEEMAPDNRVDLLERMVPREVEQLLPLVAQAERSDIRKLLSCEEDTAGSIMTTEYASLPENITVEESFQRLRQQAPDRETIYYLYILDEGRHLRGLVSLRQLVMARPEAVISEIMDRDVISVSVNDDQEFVASQLARYDFLAIPVVDEQNRLVGIVTHDDVIDVLQEEATEDAHRQGAVEPLEDSYVSTPLITLVRKRGFWLIFLFAAAFITSMALRHYHADVPPGGEWIVWFIPLVIASGGNAGAQSATLITRSLALGEIDVRRWRSVAVREVAMGAMLGSVLFGLCLLSAGSMVDIKPAAIVATSVALIVVLGTLIGSLLPLLFKRLGWDPALMSTPLVAALIDITGVVVYYEMATRIFTAG